MFASLKVMISVLHFRLDEFSMSFLTELAALPLLVKAAIMGIVEGLTEFLPISSTGHLILTGALLGFHDDKAKLFEVSIQTGAMVAVIWYFRARILRVVGGLTSDPSSRKFAVNVLIAFLPAAILGLAFASKIKAYLFKPIPVAIAFIVGGFIILWVERITAARPFGPKIHSIDDLDWKDALKLGLAQAVALIPGTSRSGATIIGGMIFGLSRKAATEFSFFLAIPTLIGAGVYDMYKYRHLVSAADIPFFAVGLIFSFISALICVHWLIKFVSTNDFRGFAYYRIVFGVIVLITSYLNIVNWSNT
jgi:undecaprenyl-diphosphatase